MMPLKTTLHRFCVNHFLRDLAKPVLALDSTAKKKNDNHGGLCNSPGIRIVLLRHLEEMAVCCGWRNSST